LHKLRTRRIAAALSSRYQWRASLATRTNPLRLFQAVVTRRRHLSPSAWSTLAYRFASDASLRDTLGDEFAGYVAWGVNDPEAFAALIGALYDTQVSQSGRNRARLDVPGPVARNLAHNKALSPALLALVPVRHAGPILVALQRAKCCMLSDHYDAPFGTLENAVASAALHAPADTELAAYLEDLDRLAAAGGAGKPGSWAVLLSREISALRRQVILTVPVPDVDVWQRVLNAFAECGDDLPTVLALAAADVPGSIGDLLALARTV
jgi:hypothetical protein